MTVVLLREDESLAENALEFGEFSTVYPIGELPGKAIALVRFGNPLLAVGLLERGRVVATQKRRVNLAELTAIEPELELDELVETMSSRLQSHMHDGPLPPKTGEEALRALVELRPELEMVIAGLRNRLTDVILRGPSYDTIAMEKDGLGLALNFLNFDRSRLREWRTSDSEPDGFLSGLPYATLREDQVLAHDMGHFGEWEIVRTSAVGAVHFQSHESELTVVNVNRTPVEEVLGVDLVYYHERYQALVLVQYKRMTREDELGHIYRPDSNLDDEIRRMKQIPSDPPDPLDAYSYRLGPGICYLKLCEEVTFDPYSRDLIPGLYLPLEYFEACANVAVGPKGGAVYGYSTVPRHLNNTQFTHLVQDGWIGSTGQLTEELRELVEALVVNGRSVLLAVGRGKPVSGRPG